MSYEIEVLQLRELAQPSLRGFARRVGKLVRRCYCYCCRCCRRGVLMSTTALQRSGEEQLCDPTGGGGAC